MIQDKIQAILYIIGLMNKSKEKIRFLHTVYGNCGLYIKYSRKSELTKTIKYKLDDVNIFYTNHCSEGGLEGKKEPTTIFIPSGDLEDYNHDIKEWYYDFVETEGI